MTTRMRVAAVLGTLVLAGAGVALAGGTGTSSPPDRAPSREVFSGGGGQSTALQVAPGAASFDAAASSGVADSRGVAGPSEPAPAPPPGPGLVPSPGAKVVRQAAITLETARRRSGSAFDRVAAVAADRGGYVASSSRSRGEAPGGTLELRVPASRFDDARAALARIAKVTVEEIHGEDVGAQLVDIEARTKSLQAEEQTLRTLVGQAKTVGEVLQVQPQLFEVRRQIEQLQAQHQNLDDAASFARLSVTITEKGAANPVRSPRPEPVLSRSAHRAWNAAGAVAGGMLIVVGAVAPLALIATLVWMALKVRRRTRRDGVAPALP